MVKIPGFFKSASRLQIYLLVPLFLFLAACDSSTNNKPVKIVEEKSQMENADVTEVSDDIVSAVAPTTIPWFNGSIDEAFAYAEEQNKPLFLYWGAIWCPPCEQIKQTVFKHPAFLAQTKLFVPVYLDGDTGRAQTWGEHFSVAGYPTMVLFSPSGEELTRIPGGIETQHYIDVFRLALNGLKNTNELLSIGLNFPEQLDQGAFTQLAFYSWEQSNFPDGVVINANVFKQLSDSAQAANDSVAFSRLFFHYLNEVFLEQDTSEAEFGEGEKNQALQTLLSILSDEDQVLANIDYMVFYAQDFVPMITSADENRQRLTQAWTTAMDKVRFSSALSSAEQLATWYPQLYLYWINDPEVKALPELVEQAVVAHINDMDEKTKGDARQTVINKSYQVLQAAHLYDESRQVLIQEIEKSHSPYYFMSGLASLEEELENNEQAVQWLQRAYRESKGAATRFQWGVEYVDGLTRIMPENKEKIIAVTDSLLRELNSPYDVFSGRNFGRLQTLVAVLKGWKNKTQVQMELEGFFDELIELCASVEPGTIAASNCGTLDM